MSDKEIVMVLNSMKRKRAELKEQREKLIEYACDKCGYDQTSARNENIELFLTGYLQGKGIFENIYIKPTKTN